MKEYFLVNKDLRMKGNKGWLEITPKQLQAAAKLKNKSAVVFEDFKDAEKVALDNDSETRFFPIYGVEVADDIEGKDDKIALDSGEKLKCIRFASKDIKMTDVYLEYIPGAHHYEDVSLAPKAEGNISPKKSIDASTKSKLSEYIPSVKMMVKSGLPLALVGVAYYVGASTIAATLAAGGLVVPAVLMTNPLFLPLIIGTAACVAVELPELAIKLGKAVISGGSQMIQVAKSRWNKKPAATSSTAISDSTKLSELAEHLIEPMLAATQLQTTRKLLLSAFNAGNVTTSAALTQAAQMSDVNIAKTRLRA